MVSAYYQSPLGGLRLEASEKGVTGIRFSSKKIRRPHGSTPVLTRCYSQLRKYFMGERKKFSVPLELEATRFQMKVWKALAEISYGDTASYRDIAKAIGYPTAARAVGRAIRSNPVAIIVPCHRVIGADGSMTGYAWGTRKKAALLSFEAVTMSGGL